MIATSSYLATVVPQPKAWKYPQPQYPLRPTQSWSQQSVGTLSAQQTTQLKVAYAILAWNSLLWWPSIIYFCTYSRSKGSAARLCSGERQGQTLDRSPIHYRAAQMSNLPKMQSSKQLKWWKLHVNTINCNGAVNQKAMSLVLPKISTLYSNRCGSLDATFSPVNLKYHILLSQFVFISFMNK